jgi:hypothetical protein
MCPGFTRTWVSASFKKELSENTIDFPGRQGGHVTSQHVGWRRDATVLLEHSWSLLKALSTLESSV